MKIGQKRFAALLESGQRNFAHEKFGDISLNLKDICKKGISLRFRECTFGRFRLDGTFWIIWLEGCICTRSFRLNNHGSAGITYHILSPYKDSITETFEFTPT